MLSGLGNSHIILILPTRNFSLQIAFHHSQGHRRRPLPRHYFSITLFMDGPHFSRHNLVETVHVSCVITL